MTVVVAAIGEEMTGGVTAGGRHIARREPLPVETSRVKSMGNMAVVERCVSLIAPRERLPTRPCL